MERTLNLVIKRRWFNMILSGEKREEYRRICKHWESRLYVPGTPVIRTIDYIVFRNGYQKNVPTVKVKCCGIDINTGSPLWGAELGKKYFRFKLGEIIGTANTGEPSDVLFPILKEKHDGK